METLCFVWSLEKGASCEVSLSGWMMWGMMWGLFLCHGKGPYIVRCGYDNDDTSKHRIKRHKLGIRCINGMQRESMFVCES